jgi:hypothetical protein
MKFQNNFFIVHPEKRVGLSSKTNRHWTLNVETSLVLYQDRELNVTLDMASVFVENYETKIDSKSLDQGQETLTEIETFPINKH